MPITVKYETLLKRAAGTGSDIVEREPRELQEVLREVAARRGEDFSSLLFSDDGHIRPSVLIFIGERQVSPAESHTLHEGDVVTLMTPISGG